MLVTLAIFQFCGIESLHMDFLNNTKIGQEILSAVYFIQNRECKRVGPMHGFNDV